MTSFKKVHRYEVPVDDEAHEHLLRGSILKAGCRERGIVEFWAEFDTAQPVRTASFRVFGTGYQIPPGAIWRGTVNDGIHLVWHLYEMR